MIEVVKSETFDKWLRGLKDRAARARIEARIVRLALGNPGDVKPVRESISELRIDHGPGYRVYFMQRGEVLVVLLVGGDKSTQEADIKRAIALAKAWKE
jgi:putative addiction module killer protein